MEELTMLLNNVSDSYFDFVDSVLDYAGRKKERLQAVLTFIKSNPSAKSSDIIEFVSNQADFFEDSAMIKIG